jgi:hypothetical protein
MLPRTRSNASYRLVLQLLRDHQDLEPRQPVDLQLEDRVGLLGVQIVLLHDLLRRVRLGFRLLHDLQDIVERVEDRRGVMHLPAGHSNALRGGPAG